MILSLCVVARRGNGCWALVKVNGANSSSIGTPELGASRIYKLSVSAAGPPPVLAESSMASCSRAADSPPLWWQAAGRSRCGPGGGPGASAASGAFAASGVRSLGGEGTAPAARETVRLLNLSISQPYSPRTRDMSQTATWCSKQLTIATQRLDASFSWVRLYSSRGECYLEDRLKTASLDAL